MKIFKQIYIFITFSNIIMFIIYFLMNIETLNNISYTTTISGTSATYTVNFYAATAILTAVIAVLIVLGINIYGSGFNDATSSLISRYILNSVLYALFLISNAYFLLPYGVIGTTFILIISIFYIFYAISNLSGGNNYE